jgi:hypothetical protein
MEPVPLPESALLPVAEPAWVELLLVVRLDPVAARSGEGVDRGGACRAHAKGRLGRLLKLSSTLLLT